MSSYSVEEQVEIVGEAIRWLIDAETALGCIEGDDAEAARFDVGNALARAAEIRKSLRRQTGVAS